MDSHAGIGGDPHYSILLPTGQAMCFSVHGEKDFSFNLISNDKFLMNAYFIQDAIRDEITWIGSLGIIVKNTSSLYSENATIKLRFDAVDKSIHVGRKAVLYAQEIEKIVLGSGHSRRLVISHADTRSPQQKRIEVFVSLEDAGLSFTVRFVKDHLDLFWHNVENQPKNSHGIIGNYTYSYSMMACYEITAIATPVLNSVHGTSLPDLHSVICCQVNSSVMV